VTHAPLIGDFINSIDQFLPHAPQQKQPAFSSSKHHEVGHRPAGWCVIFFAKLQRAWP
jgi:hypothetical protein